MQAAMQALCKIAPTQGGIGLRQLDIPQPGSGEVRIRVAAAGICGTDMQIWNWAPRMARRMHLPRVLGHEISGVIDALGPGLEQHAGGNGATGGSALQCGDHVSLESHVYCGHCRQCHTGRAHLCASTTYPGIDFDGGFAEYVVVPASIVWVNPPDLPHDIAAMLEPCGIAVHASLAGSGVAGQSVLINGCGPIGLMNVAAARALGARRIIASDPNPLRRQCALQLGADRAVNPVEENLAAVVRDLTGSQESGGGVDVGIEYSGTEAGFQAVFDSLCKGGDFRLVGAPPSAIPVDFSYWLIKCPNLHTIHGRRIWDSWVQTTDLLQSGRMDIRPVASHVLPLSEAARGFELIRAGEALKPILVPG